MWTSAVILQLVGEGRMRLDDTVQRWLPGLLPYGSRITVRQLLSHTSGMIDSNEIVAHPYRYLAEVKSPALRAKILAISRRLGTDRAYEFSPRYWIESQPPCRCCSSREPRTATRVSATTSQV